MLHHESNGDSSAIPLAVCLNSDAAMASTPASETRAANRLHRQHRSSRPHELYRSELRLRHRYRRCRGCLLHRGQCHRIGRITCMMPAICIGCIHRFRCRIAPSNTFASIAQMRSNQKNLTISSNHIEFGGLMYGAIGKFCGRLLCVDALSRDTRTSKESRLPNYSQTSYINGPKSM